VSAVVEQAATNSAIDERYIGQPPILVLTIEKGLPDVAELSKKR
jgi:hypothetical protein